MNVLWTSRATEQRPVCSQKQVCVETTTTKKWRKYWFQFSKFCSFSRRETRRAAMLRDIWLVTQKVAWIKKQKYKLVFLHALIGVSCYHDLTHWTCFMLAVRLALSSHPSEGNRELSRASSMIAHGISANSAGICRSIGSIWISVGPEVYIQREVLQTTLIVQFSPLHISDLRAR